MWAKGGWLGYFGISEYYRPIPELDEWLRRRIRMCYWKQWRWPRTNDWLQRQGVPSIKQLWCKAQGYTS